MQLVRLRALQVISEREILHSSISLIHPIYALEIICSPNASSFLYKNNLTQKLVLKTPKYYDPSCFKMNWLQTYRVSSFYVICMANLVWFKSNGNSRTPMDLQSHKSLNSYLYIITSVT